MEKTDFFYEKKSKTTWLQGGACAWPQVVSGVSFDKSPKSKVQKKQAQEDVT